MTNRRYTSKEEVEFASGIIIPPGQITVEKPTDSETWICEITYHQPIETAKIGNFTLKAKTGETIEIIKPKLQSIFIDYSIDQIDE